MNDTMMQALQHEKHAWALRHEMGFPADAKLTPSIEFGTGGAIDGGIVRELVLRAMECDQDIIYAGSAHAGMPGPKVDGVTCAVRLDNHQPPCGGMAP